MRRLYINRLQCISKLCLAGWRENKTRASGEMRVEAGAGGWLLFGWLNATCRSPQAMVDPTRRARLCRCQVLLAAVCSVIVVH